VEREYRTLRVDFRNFVQLQDLCESKGFTIANALHAAWSLTLRCYTSSDEVCFGYLLSEREVTVDKAEDAVGPMINMLACRVNMPNDSSLVQVLERIQDDYMQSLPHKHTSLAEVQHALGLSATALFNTCFSYRKLPSPIKGRQPTLEFSEFVPIHDPTEYLVTANVEATDRDAAIDIDYWTDTMSDEQASNIATTFLKALHNLIDHSEEKIGQLNLISDEQIQLISQWNSFMPPTIEKCIHEVVHEQALLRPQSPAICSWDANVTYEQLDDLSTRLAYYLIGLGVASESYVALCFEKSAWTMVAMLAVLKTGGGCVPLDAGHPKSALELRVLETNAEVVLASPSCVHILDDVVPYVVPIDEEFLNELPMDTSGLELDIARPSNPAFVIFTSGKFSQLY
jgi:non-ribosomal peptide synthetase component F